MIRSSTTPRPNSQTGKVYRYLKAGLSRPAIERETGLSGMTLTYAIRTNYRFGYVPTPPLAERRQQLRLNTSAGKGGVWLAIKDYAPLFLTARQTQVAVQREQGRSFSLIQVSSAYHRERHRNHLVRPVAELAIEGQRDKRRTEAELLEIVHLRLTVDALLAAESVARPTTLHEWLDLSFTAKLNELGVVKRNYSDWLHILRVYRRHQRPVPRKWPLIGMRDEVRFIRVMQRQESLLHRKLLRNNGIGRTTTTEQRDLILDCYYALKSYRDEGIVPDVEVLRDIPSDVIEQLVRQVPRQHAKNKRNNKQYQ